MTITRHPLTAFTLISAVCVAVVSGAGAASFGGSPIQSNYGAYDTALEARYKALANLEANEGDSDDEWHYWTKARAAADGYMVVPDDPKTRELGAADMAFAQDTYKRILSAYSLGLPEREVAGMADAVANFDCWMNDTEEGSNLRRAAACRLRVAEVLTRLEARYPEKFALADAGSTAPDQAARRTAPVNQFAAAGETPMADMPAKPALPVAYTVFFGFDSAKLQPEAQSTIDTAAKQAMGVQSVAVAVNGHADRAGPSDYNRVLAEKRADAVVAALAAKGIPAVRIDEVSHGEADPAVPTPDGVAEPRNRRVVIQIDDR